MSYKHIETFLYFTNSREFKSGGIPEVDDLYSGKIKKDSFDKNLLYDTKYKIIPKDNQIQVLNTIDALYGLEINGSMDNYDKILSVDFFIGGSQIIKFYLEKCEIIKNNNFFTLIIDFRKIFYSSFFLPICSLIYHDIKFIINGENIQEFNYYLFGSFFYDSKIRNTYSSGNFRILLEEYVKYDGFITGNKLGLILENNNLVMNNNNIINSLYFKFDINIHDKLKSVSINFLSDKNKNLINCMSLNDIKFISNNEFILDSFNYKTFLFNQILLEFELSEDFNNNKYSIITTNFNVLLINSGCGILKYKTFKRQITDYSWDIIDKEQMSEDVDEFEILSDTEII